MNSPIENILKGKTFDSPKQERKYIFSEFIKRDESNLWPIRGRFNATKRAIRHLYKFEAATGYYMTGYELTAYLEDELSRIVNDPKLL